MLKIALLRKRSSSKHRNFCCPKLVSAEYSSPTFCSRNFRSIFVPTIFGLWTSLSGIFVPGIFVTGVFVPRIFDPRAFVPRIFLPGISVPWIFFTGFLVPKYSSSGYLSPKFSSSEYLIPEYSSLDYSFRPLLIFFVRYSSHLVIM